ncbi:MAG: hypothetical protein ACLFSL_02575 [Candidatus Woesearchaeota archaeon]
MVSEIFAMILLIFTFISGRMKNNKYESPPINFMKQDITDRVEENQVEKVLAKLPLGRRLSEAEVDELYHTLEGKMRDTALDYRHREKLSEEAASKIYVFGEYLSIPYENQ